MIIQIFYMQIIYLRIRKGEIKMLEFKGITVGTYISKKVKKGQPKDVCSNCKLIKKLQTKKQIKKRNMKFAKIVRNSIF